MIRLIAIAGFALAVATSAEAMTPAPIPQPDGIMTHEAWGYLRGQNHCPACSPGRSEVCILARRRLPSVVLTTEHEIDVRRLSARRCPSRPSKRLHL